MLKLESRFALGEKVMALGLSAKVIAIIFMEGQVRYELAFDAGGANSTLDSTLVGQWFG